MNNSFRIVLGTVLILFVPLVAMQFTDEVNWTLSDFIIAGALLLGAGFAYQLATIRVKDTKRKAVIGILILLALVLVWADLAVGIFNIPGFSGS